MGERNGRGRAASLLAVAALGLAGCATPRQAGELVVLPGAAERLMLAMSMGYGGAGDAKRPARVWRLSFAEDQLKGQTASGRVGDYLLENKRVSVVIANVDGGARGGHLVDMARASARVDGLGELETIVSGMRVRYRTLKAGTDPQLGTAWVNVVGYAESDPSIEVATRYDIGPELDMVLVHTTMKPAGRALAGPIAIGDSLVAAGAEAGATHAASLSGASGYLLQPLVDGAPLVTGASGSRASIGQGPESTSGEELVLYSRALVALERPDTLAMATALAEIDGKPTGEVELEVAVRADNARSSLAGGQFLLGASSSDQEGVALRVEQTLYPGDRLLARAPAGRWFVGYEGAGRRTRARAVADVRPRVRTPVRMEAPLEPAAPAAPASIATAAAPPDAAAGAAGSGGAQTPR